MATKYDRCRYLPKFCIFIIRNNVVGNMLFRHKVQFADTDPVAVTGGLGVTIQVRQQSSSIHTLEVHTGLGEKRREEPMVFLWWFEAQELCVAKFNSNVILLL